MPAFITLTSPETTALWLALANILASVIAGSLLGIAALVNAWTNRWKPNAEIHEARARAAREWAEADEIRLRGTLTLSEEAGHWTKKMMRAQTIIFQLQEENEQLKMEVRRLRDGEQKQIGGRR